MQVLPDFAATFVKICSREFKRNGGFGQYVSVPSEQVFIMDDQISIEEATLAEPVACCIHSLLGAGAFCR